MTIEKVWTMVEKTAAHNLTFVWILSLMTKQYFRDSIIDDIIRLHPSVIQILWRQYHITTLMGTILTYLCYIYLIASAQVALMSTLFTIS